MTQKQRTKAIFKAHKRMYELVEELDSWLETIEVMQQFPNLEEDSKKAWQEVKEGKAVSLEEIFNEKGEYVPRHRRKKSRQAARKD